MPGVREVKAGYEARYVFHVDETSLSFRMLSEATYLAPHENRRTVRGVEGMSAEECITLDVACPHGGCQATPLLQDEGPTVHVHPAG